MSFLSNDDMLSFMTDIPKEVFKAMPYISVAIDVVISIFTFGIGTAIKMAVQLANEVAMIEGAYDKLIKIIASTVEKDLDLQLIDVNNVDFLRDFDDIKNNEKKIKNYSNSIPESNEVNYDKMTYAKVEEDFKKHEKNYNKCVQTNELSKKQFSIFSNNINNSIERELQQCLKGVTKKPVFKGIVAGLIAAVFAAGKALKKMLIKVCKQIVRRSKELIKKSKNVMKEHYRKLLKKQKDEVNKAKLKYDKLKRKYEARKKKEDDLKKKKQQEELKKELKKYVKDYIKDLGQNLKDAFRDNLKVLLIGLFGTSGLAYLDLFDDVFLYLVTTLKQLGTLFEDVLKEFIALLPLMDDLLKSLLILMKHGVETLIILLLMIPLLFILYQTVVTIQALERKYVDK